MDTILIIRVPMYKTTIKVFSAFIGQSIICNSFNTYLLHQAMSQNYLACILDFPIPAFRDLQQIRSYD